MEDIIIFLVIMALSYVFDSSKRKKRKKQKQSTEFEVKETKKLKKNKNADYKKFFDDLSVQLKKTLNAEDEFFDVFTTTNEENSSKISKENSEKLEEKIVERLESENMEPEVLTDDYFSDFEQRLKKYNDELYGDETESLFDYSNLEDAENSESSGKVEIQNDLNFELRKAIVISEILDRPVSLRK